MFRVASICPSPAAPSAQPLPDNPPAWRFPVPLSLQNVQREICEMLLRKGADVNHANARGNTALHFAMAYDAEGLLGEMLISKGGDDTLTNVDGLTCYDGFARQSR